MKNSTITQQTIQHVAHLAQIPVTETEAEKLATAFNETLAVVQTFSELSTETIEPTHQVTGLENVWRKDQVMSEYSFTQTQALANATAQHAGYFVVPQVIDQS